MRVVWPARHGLTRVRVVRPARRGLTTLGAGRSARPRTMVPMRAATLAGPAVAAPARGEARAALLGVAPALVGGRHDLGHEEVVLRPLDGDLLADELLDHLDAQRAGLVHERHRLAASAGPGRAPDAMDIVQIGRAHV